MKVTSRSFDGLLHREACVTAVSLIDEVELAVSPKPSQHRRHRVDREFQLTLGNGQFGLALPARFLGALALIDVDDEVVPANDAPARIPKRKSVRLKPAINPIGASKTD